jgi:hypothetical protein
MSSPNHDGSYDSGRNHLKPALLAIILSAAVTILTILIAGPPL